MRRLNSSRSARHASDGGWDEAMARPERSLAHSLGYVAGAGLTSAARPGPVESPPRNQVRKAEDRLISPYLPSLLAHPFDSLRLQVRAEAKLLALDPAQLHADLGA